MAERRLKQSEVATAVGVTQSRVSRWLSRRGLPSDENVAVLATILDRDPKYLQRIVAADRRDLFGEVDRRSTFDRLDALDERMGRLERKLDRILKRLDAGPAAR